MTDPLDTLIYAATEAAEALDRAGGRLDAHAQLPGAARAAYAHARALRDALRPYTATVDAEPDTRPMGRCWSCEQRRILNMRAHPIGLVGLCDRCDQ